MTDQRTLKRIITDQRNEIHKLKTEYQQEITTLTMQLNELTEAFDIRDKQVKAAIKILSKDDFQITDLVTLKQIFGETKSG